MRVKQLICREKNQHCGQRGGDAEMVSADIAFLCLDNVKSAVWVRKGDFVEQSVLKRIAGILEKGATIVWE